MTWLEVMMLLAVLAGLFAGAVLVAQRPTFWVGLATVMFKAGLPHIVKYVGKRMPPEQEQAWRDCIRRNGKWNHQKRRCE